MKMDTLTGLLIGFYDYQAELIQSGIASPLSGMEVITLQSFLNWLEREHPEYAAAPAMYEALKLAYEFIVSTHPQDSVGSELKGRALDAVCNALARGKS